MFDRKEYMRNYQKSDKYKSVRRKWRVSEKGRECKRKYYEQTRVDGRRVKYTEDEDALVLAHNMTDRELSELLCRSMKSIQCRRGLLKKQVGWKEREVLE